MKTFEEKKKLIEMNPHLILLFDEFDFELLKLAVSINPTILIFYPEDQIIKLGLEQILIDINPRSVLYLSRVDQETHFEAIRRDPYIYYQLQNERTTKTDYDEPDWVPPPYVYDEDDGIKFCRITEEKNEIMRSH